LWGEVVQEMALKQKQDHIIECENKETTELRGILMLDNGMKPDLVILDVDETAPAEGNENQDISDFNKVRVLAQSLLNYFI
jgi:hypothetical protein